MRDDNNSVRPGRIAGVGFNESVAVVLDSAAGIAARATGQVIGEAALRATAAYVRQLQVNDPRIFVLFAHGHGDNGAYVPSRSALDVISQTAGQWNDSPTAEEVLSDLALAQLEDALLACQATAASASGRAVAAEQAAEAAQAAVTDIAPLHDRIAQLEAAATEDRAAMATIVEERDLLKAGYESWVKASKAAAKQARPKVAAAA